jgi:Flp pilus assembly protein TadD
MLRTITLPVVASACLLVAPLSAQSTSSLRWVLQVVGSSDGATPEERVLLDTQNELTLSTSLDNSEGPGVWGVLTAMPRLKVTIAAGKAAIPIQVTTRLSDPPMGVALKPGEGMRMEMILRRTDKQPFAPGSYTVTLHRSEALKALTFENGAKWTGRSNSLDTLTVTIRDVSTPEHRLAYLDSKGNQEFGRGNYKAAIPLLEQLVGMAPERWHPHFVLGSAYMHVGRPQDAVAQWQLALPQAMRLPGDEKVYVGTALARTYLRLNRRDDAVKTLRSIGLNDQQIAARVKELQSGQ